MSDLRQGMFGDAYFASDLAIGSMTEGISKYGMEGLVDTLQLELLEKVSNDLRDVTAVGNAIKAGWQGKSRDAFLQDFERSINIVTKDLRSEYYDLLNRLAELMKNYFNQDLKMAQEFGYEINDSHVSSDSFMD